METTNKIQVFLVDDDEMFINTLKHTLSKSQLEIEISTFSTGEECIKNLNLRPSVVVLDYNLDSDCPGAMDGVQTLKKIKEKLPDTEVIMLSAQENVETAVQTLRGGAFEYITKNKECFFKIKNILSLISDDIAYSENVNKQVSSEGIMTATVIMIFILCFLISRFL